MARHDKTIDLLPEFNAAGDMPPSVYRVTLSAVITRFGHGSLQRALLAERLTILYQTALSTGKVAHFIVFGSFVTSKIAPNDVDIVILMQDDFDAKTLDPKTAMLFDHAIAQNYEGASIFWVRKMAALGGVKQFIQDWQRKRDGTLRGIIEVIPDDSK